MDCIWNIYRMEFLDRTELAQFLKKRPRKKGQVVQIFRNSIFFVNVMEFFDTYHEERCDIEIDEDDDDNEDDDNHEYCRRKFSSTLSNRNCLSALLRLLRIKSLTELKTYLAPWCVARLREVGDKQHEEELKSFQKDLNIEDTYSHLAPVIKRELEKNRDPLNLDSFYSYSPFKSDPNEKLFPLPKDVDPRCLRSWAEDSFLNTSLQPGEYAWGAPLNVQGTELEFAIEDQLDPNKDVCRADWPEMESFEFESWETLPSDVIKEDLTTIEQDKVIAVRLENGELTTQQKERRMKSLARILSQRRSHYDERDCNLWNIEWRNELSRGWEAFQNVCL